MKLYFSLLWFAGAYLTLILSIIFLILISGVKQITPTSQNFRLYVALPDSTIQSSDSIVSSDGRAQIIRNFFKRYKSPLENHADTFIAVADKYRLDYRLLPAISMQESNGAKRIIADSFNPFGYGIYGDNVKRFSNFDEAIERVGRGLREDYLNEGLTTPNSIMAKYTPPSLSKGGAWAKGVSSFMEELR